MSTAAKPPIRVVGLVAAMSLLLPACGSGKDAEVDVGGPMTVNKDVLASQVKSQLTKDLGEPAPPVSCPGGLDAREGATTTCTMSGPKGTYDIAVTVTRMEFGDVVLDDGSPGNVDFVGNAYFDIKVADKPNL